MVFTVTDEPGRETVRVEGIAKKEATLVPEILRELAKQLNQEGKFVTTLPLLNYKDQEKVGVLVQPSQICMRSYSEEGMRETVVDFTA